MKTIIDTPVFASDLARTIAQADAAERLRLHPQLTRALDVMRGQGQPIPAKLRELHSELLDEAIEAQFDNLPI